MDDGDNLSYCSDHSDLKTLSDRREEKLNIEVHKSDAEEIQENKSVPDLEGKKLSAPCYELITTIPKNS